MCLKTGASKPTDLVKLLSALQASLFYWCRTKLASDATKEIEPVRQSISHLINKCKEVAHRVWELKGYPSSVGTKGLSIKCGS